MFRRKRPPRGQADPSDTRLKGDAKEQVTHTMESSRQNQQFRIKLDKKLKLSNKHFARFISSTVADNDGFLNQSPFPSAEEMARLAEAVYTEVSELEKLQLPEGWKFLTAAYNNSWGNCYFGAAFWNRESRQVVVAHRGTDYNSAKKIVSVIFNTDLRGVKYTKYVPQISSAVTFAEKVREAISDKHAIHLNFTGHSLGGWLAQITTFSIKYLRPQQIESGINNFLLDPNSIEDYHPHTVVFESPGCKEMLAKMKTHLAPAVEECKAYKRRLDIIIFLTLTNWVNTTNTHLGTILVFKEHLFHRYWNSINPIRTHSISGIVDVFKQHSYHSDLIEQVHEFLDNQPYTTRDYDSTICSLSQFTRDELYFLINMETLQTNGLQYSHEILDSLPKISLDSNQYKLISRKEEDLNKIVKLTKQGMLTQKNDFHQYINVHNFEISHKSLQFVDNFGLMDFLNSNDHLLLIVTDKKNSIVSAINSILHFNNFGEQSDKKHNAIYLTWQNLEKIPKITDLSTIFGMSPVIVIECTSKESSGFFDDIIKYLRQRVVQMQKCILISESGNTFSEASMQKLGILRDIPEKYLDLEETSQHAFLKQTFNQNNYHVSEMDVFYRPIHENVSLTNVVMFLKTENNTKFFITCSDKEADIYSQLVDEAAKKELKEAEILGLVKINSGERKHHTEWMTDFKIFCQMNSTKQVILLKITNKEGTNDKSCICTCIYNGDLCILRQLQSRWLVIRSALVKALLSQKLNDMCIIVTEEDSQHEIPFLQELRQVQSIYIVSSMIEAVNLSQSSEYPSHIFKFIGTEHLEWMSTRKSLSDIQSYVLQESNKLNSDNQNFFSEQDFIAKAKKTIIIADEPGMGKTTTSTKLLHKLKGSARIYLDLKKCTEGIRMLSDNLNLEEVIEFLIKHFCDNHRTLDVSLLRKALRTNLYCRSEYKVLTVLFDGFDEIPYEGHAGNVLHLKLLKVLQFLSHKTTARVWVTTRKHYLNMLQEGLLVFCTSFQKISESIQKDYLKNHWKTVLKLQLDSHEELESKVNSYTNQLYKKATEVLEESITEFMGIPLLMRMLLEVARPRCVDSCTIDTNVFISLNAASLYNEFVDLKFTIYFEQKHNNTMTGTQKDVFIDKLCCELENLAFNNHFKKEVKGILTDEEIHFHHLNECHRLGFVQQTDVTSDSAEFIHRTFQEYFVAKKLLKLITSKCSFEVIELLITKVLLQDSYKIIRLFLNHQLQTFITKTDSTKLTLNNMWNEDRHRLFDAQGNSCFSTLARENHENLMKFLIIAFGECAVKMLTMQNKNKQTPLAIAIEKENTELIRMIKETLNAEHQNEVVEATAFTLVDEAFQKFKYDGVLCNHLITYWSLTHSSTRHYELMEKFLSCNSLKNLINVLRSEKFYATSEFFYNAALLMAAYHGHYKVAEYLVSQMNYLDYSDFQGRTALHLAAQQGHFHIVQLLLDKGATCEILNYDHLSYLHYAVQHTRSLELIEKLLELLCSTFKRFKKENAKTLLHLAIECYKNDSYIFERFQVLLDLLTENGNVDVTNVQKETPLICACKIISDDTVKYLVNKGANVNAQDEMGRTPLHFAVSMQNLTVSSGNIVTHSDESIKLLRLTNHYAVPQLVEYLVSKGANINVADKAGWTVLHHAVDCYSHKETILPVVKILVENGAHIDPVNEKGVTPLMLASQHALPEVVEYLIMKGANLNTADQNEMSVLHFAVNRYPCGEDELQNMLFIAKSLTENKANINAVCKKGITPLMLASQNSLSKVVRYFILKGARVDTIDSTSKTALHFVVSNKYLSYERHLQTAFETIQILTENGADIDAIDQQGLSPLTLAIKNGFPEVVQHLIVLGAKISAADDSFKTALHFAVDKNVSVESNIKAIVSCIKILVENGANVDAVDCRGITPLILASKNGIPEIVENLLLKSANVNITDHSSWTPLHHAIAGHLDDAMESQKILQIVKMLVENGAHIDAVNDAGATPLMIASHYGLPEVMEYLISKGAKLNVTDKTGRTALHYNIWRYSAHKSESQVFLSAIKLLIENGANIEVVDCTNNTPFMLAIQNGSAEVVKYLLSKGASITAKYEKGQTAAHVAIKTPTFRDILGILTEYGIDTDAANNKGVTPLMLACKGGLPEVVKYLISNGANVHITDKHGNTTLHYAVHQTSDKKEPQTILNIARILTENGANVDTANKIGVTSLMLASQNSLPEVVEYLISNRANINTTDENGWTALHYVVSQRSVKEEPQAILKVTRILTENGANVDPANKKGSTPLMFASQNGLPEVVEYLISNRANVNTTDEDGWTALHLAVSQTFEKKEPQTILNVTRILTENEANVDAANNQGFTPLIFASRNGLPEVVEYLISNGANVNTTDENGKTPLHYAVSQTSGKKEPQTILNIARILIENEANVDAANKKGFTPLMFASQNGLPEIVEYLISNGAKVNTTDEDGRTALHFAAVQTSDKKEPQTILNVTRILTENEANVDAASKKGVTSLMLASRNSLPEVVEYLISKGANVNTTDENGWTALHISASQRSVKNEPQAILKVTWILTENGANIDAADKKGSTPLMFASQNGLLEVIKYLISNRANINTTDEDGRTALHYAVTQTSDKKEPQTILNVTRILTENEAIVDAANNVGSTPLMLASRNGLPEVVEYLISNGANVNTTDENGQTALHYVVSQLFVKSEPQIILKVSRILIENGANFDAASKKGVTLLMLASENDLPEVVEYLISKGANVNTTDENGKTALHCAVSQTSDKKEPQRILNIARILIENEANVDAANKKGFTPLMFASQNGLPEIVEYLISNGAKVNTTDEDGRTALHFAAVQTSDKKEPQTILNVVRILIANRANVDAADKRGNTPLMLASRNSLPEVVEYLISKGGNVNATDENGWTALHVAASQISVKKEPQAILKVTRILTENGANVDAANNKGSTPLMFASQNGLLEVVEYLISKGTNINTTDENGWTALHVVVSQRSVKEESQAILKVTRILTENGANVDAANKIGFTPLIFASRNGLPEVVEYLISNGANVNTTDEDGWTALHRAVSQTFEKKEPQTILKVTRILTENGANVDAANKIGITSLILASRNSLLKVVDYLISKGANVNTTDKSGWTALHFAVSQRSVKEEPQAILKVTRILIENGANVDAANKIGVTSLMLASQNSLPEVVEYLISKGANVNTTDKNGWTALHVSASQRSVKEEPQAILKVTRILTENGANVDAANKKGFTPLIFASRNGLPEIVEYLISNGANVNTTDEDGWTALHRAVSQTEKKEPQTILKVTRILTENGANVDAASKKGVTLLMLASQNGLPKVVEYLISNGANVYTTDTNGWMALHYAVSQISVEKEPQPILSVVRILIANGANVDAANKKGFTPLMFASQNGLPEVVEYLISKGANVNTTDENGWTALHVAVSQRSVKKEPQAILKVTRILTENEANVDAANKEGSTPLMFASQNSLPEIVEYLISKGANVNTTDKFGRTALHVAASQRSVKKKLQAILKVTRILTENGANVDAAIKIGVTSLMLASRNSLPEIVEYLISNGANVNTTDTNGWTTLHYAVHQTSDKKEPHTMLNVTGILIENGANVNAASKKGVTPLMLAIENGLPEAVEYLMSKGANLNATDETLLDSTLCCDTNV